MLPQSVERLGCVGREAVGRLPGVFSVQLNWFVGTRYAVTFMEERHASSLKEADIASSEGKIHS